jgi:hypothetical protein
MLASLPVPNLEDEGQPFCLAPILRPETWLHQETTPPQHNSPGDEATQTDRPLSTTSPGGTTQGCHATVLIISIFVSIGPIKSILECRLAGHSEVWHWLQAQIQEITVHLSRNLSHSWRKRFVQLRLGFWATDVASVFPHFPISFNTTELKPGT